MENTVENIEQDQAPKKANHYWRNFALGWGSFASLMYIFQGNAEAMTAVLFFMCLVLVKVTFGSKINAGRSPEVDERWDEMRNDLLTNPAYSFSPSNSHHDHFSDHRNHHRD